MIKYLKSPSLLGAQACSGWRSSPGCVSCRSRQLSAASFKIYFKLAGEAAAAAGGVPLAAEAATAGSCPLHLLQDFYELGKKEQHSGLCVSNNVLGSNCC